MNGLALYDQLQTFAHLKDLPTIMISAYEPPSLELRRRHVVLLRKPFQLSRLLAGVQTALAQPTPLNSARRALLALQGWVEQRQHPDTHRPPKVNEQGMPDTLHTSEGQAATIRRPGRPRSGLFGHGGMFGWIGQHLFRPDFPRSLRFSAACFHINSKRLAPHLTSTRMMGNTTVTKQTASPYYDC